eukprot:TRINITY_DN760_c0_g1_i1.p1 TRINITY_DN760_c0_g1~~TRINITY_DN760_c0_g1_i1.p1  ORF type:complete len:62 (+),score=8.91 TRINITY_DN760_c0_g1_i1:258-443(+)
MSGKHISKKSSSVVLCCNWHNVPVDLSIYDLVEEIRPCMLCKLELQRQHFFELVMSPCTLR